MEQKTTLAQSIDVVQQKAQYDEACKKVLAEKIILAWIMKHTITEYSLTEKNHVGKVEEIAEYYDLMSAITVCLGKNEEETEHDLLRLLDVLLSSDKKAKEKKEILENDFQIPMTEKMETEVEHMCNLSDGVEQKGIEKGIEETKRTTIINMLKGDEPIEKICLYAECDKEYVIKVREELATI